jgi:hypothetical protein
MELSTKSWHARLYKLTYGLKYGYLPSNLCPYFWKLVVAIILFLPLMTWHWVRYCSIKILDIYNEIKGHQYHESPIRLLVWDEITSSFATNLVAFAGVGIIYLLGSGFDDYCVPLFIFGIIGMGLIGLLTIALCIHLIYKYVQNHKVEIHDSITVDKKPRKPSILAEFIKAKYNKYCPQIKWIK